MTTLRRFRDKKERNEKIFHNDPYRRRTNKEKQEKSIPDLELIEPKIGTIKSKISVQFL